MQDVTPTNANAGPFDTAFGSLRAFLPVIAALPSCSATAPVTFGTGRAARRTTLHTTPDLVNEVVSGTEHPKSGKNPLFEWCPKSLEEGLCFFEKCVRPGCRRPFAAPDA
ncbi:hypothetical protein Hesp01_74220 [Herbidospora sp. NBRC 101105]|nr:hypothetical protein Hesp01_74220 [Herbidospora sp. NBRC 101105]